MKRPKSVTVVLPAQGVEGAIASVVRDLAVAAYALQSRDMELDVLLLAGGRDRTAAIAPRGAGGAGPPGLGARRWVLGRAANSVFRTLTGAREIKDATTSFRVARVEVVRDFDMTGIAVNSYSVQTAFVAMAIAGGYRVGEVPIIYWPAARPRPPELHTAADVRRLLEHLLTLRGEVRRTRQARLAAPGRTFTDDHFDAADDLERLGTAERFFNWVLDEFHPYLKGSILEVGAGTGTITRQLVQRYPQLRVTALEPAENVVGDLESFAAVTPQVTVLRQTLTAVGPLAMGGYDAVLYLNVLEHIEDDAAELRRAAEALRPGGALLVFGPALSWLYGELDYKAGHYRRYSVDGLRGLAEA